MKKCFKKCFKTLVIFMAALLVFSSVNANSVSASGVNTNDTAIEVNITGNGTVSIFAYCPTCEEPLEDCDCPVACPECGVYNCLLRTNPPPLNAVFEGGAIAHTRDSWDSIIPGLRHIPHGGSFVVPSGPYGGGGSPAGNILEAFRDASGKTTIYMWPVSVGHPDQLNALVRAARHVLRPGDELVFHEGVYHRIMANDWNHVGLNAGGTPDNPIIIRGYGNGQARPQFTGIVPSGGNVFHTHWSNVVYDFLDISSAVGSMVVAGLPKGMGPDINGNFVGSGITPFVQSDAHPDYPFERPVDFYAENVTISNSIIRSMPGQYNLRVQTAGTEYRNIKVLYNDFIGHVDAAMYIGHPTYHAPIYGFTVRGNFFEHYYMHVFGPQSGSQVGYTMQAKRGVLGVVFENNLIMNPWGPGLFFYGAYPHFEYPHPHVPNSYIRNNVVIGGRGDGILVGGGPVVVENNITIGTPTGIRVHDYGGRYRYENVWRNMYFFNNFGADGGIGAHQGNFVVAPAFHSDDPNIGRPGYGSAIGIGDVVIDGNVSVPESFYLRAGFDSLMAHRTRPDGFDGLMAAINARYNSNLGAFTEDEVIALMIDYMDMEMEVNLGEDPIETPTFGAFGWAGRSGFYNFSTVNRVVEPDPDTGIASLTFRVTPRHEDTFDSATPYNLRLGLFLFGSDADISNLTTDQTFFFHMMNTAANDYSNVPMFIYFQRVNGNVDPGAIRVGRGTPSGSVGGNFTTANDPIAAWAFNTTYIITVELDTINQRYRARINGNQTNWIDLPAGQPPVMDIGQFGWAVWNNVTDTYAVIGDIPWNFLVAPQFPPDVPSGFVRHEMYRENNVARPMITTAYYPPLQPVGTADYIEYRMFFNPTYAAPGAALQINFIQALADGTPAYTTPHQNATLQLRGSDAATQRLFWFRGGGAAGFALDWSPNNTYELVFRINPGTNQWGLAVYENGNHRLTAAPQAIGSSATPPDFSHGVAAVQLLVSGWGSGDIAAYFDVPAPITEPDSTFLPLASGHILALAGASNIASPVETNVDAQRFPAGTIIRLAATPNTGYELYSLEVATSCGQEITLSETNTFIMPNLDTEHVVVTAVFVPTQSAGDVTVTFVVEAGAVGAYASRTSYVELLAGEEIPANAIPSTVARTGFYFAGWYPSDPAMFGAVSEDVTFTARFNPLFHYVTFEAGSGGELTPTSFGSVVRIRDGFTFWADRVPTPVANSGYEFVSWAPYNPAGFVVRGDMTFTAMFEPVVVVPVEPQILSVTPNPAVVQRGDIVELVVTTQGMPNGAWIELNVAWRAGLSVVGGPRFTIVDNKAIITVTADATARVGRDGVAVTARIADTWGASLIIDSYVFVIDVQ